jgi:acetyl-CoA/propionyl-CoA carboxylase biotin carboxyl carrier protein
MRTVRDPAALADALASARREATAAFGDPRLILERFVEGPRHVEVQVLFDGLGNGIHLGERDCSIQRRHQKILEETPSPAVTPELRERLGADALRLASAVGYASAGTCEFLLTDRGEVFFLEMNTRLQVEHPVTELVTGRDLVADQLRMTSGEPLGSSQAEVDVARARGGHAIEVRLYAEDAEDGFLPATGRAERLRWPSGEGIRVDAGIDEGDEIGGRFDPMLAKVMAHGADRGEALGRLTTALDSTVVLGLTTNLRFLRWLVREPAVRDGQARIDTLDRIWPPDDWASRVRAPDAAWDAAAHALGAGGWRLNGPRRARLLADDGSERTVELGGQADIGSVFEVAVAGDIAHVDIGGRSVAFRLAPPPDVDRAARAAVSHHAGGPAEVDAPMPGNVLAVHVSAGAAVEAGDPLITLEAMKMEHVVSAPFAGTVAELRVHVADQVARGQTLAILEP